MDIKNRPIAAAPVILRPQQKGHQKGAQRDPHPVKAGDKIHVCSPIVKCHIIIQRGINGSRSEPQWDGKQAQPDHTAGQRKAEQAECCQGGAHSGDLCRAKSVDQPRAQQAGYHATAGDQECDKVRIGDGDIQLLIDRGPRRPEQGVRNAQPDKGNIDYHEQDGSQ